METIQERGPGHCALDYAPYNSLPLNYNVFTHSTNRNPSRTSRPFPTPLFLFAFCLFVCLLTFLPLTIPLQISNLDVPPCSCSAHPEMRGCEDKQIEHTPLRPSKAALAFLLRSKPGPTDRWAFLKVTQQVGGKAEIRPLLPCEEGQEGFLSTVQREREAAAGPNGFEKRLLWGPSEHS